MTSRVLPVRARAVRRSPASVYRHRHRAASEPSWTAPWRSTNGATWRSSSSGSQAQFYVNGNLTGTKPLTATMTARGQLLRVGADASPWQFYRGALDNVRIYNRTLTTPELQSDMNTAVGSGGAPDTTAPSTPSGLTASAAGATRIDLSWTASSDNVGVSEYHVERCQGTGCTNFVEVATPTTDDLQRQRPVAVDHISLPRTRRRLGRQPQPLLDDRHRDYRAAAGHDAHHRRPPTPTRRRRQRAGST